MTTTSKVIKGAGLITVARITGYALSFARNVLLARMLTKADFGLASLLTMTLALLDLTSRTSVNQQVVQSRAGDTTEFRNTCHAVQAALGCASALLLALLAWPVAVLCNVPDVTWAFALLSLAPLVNGFLHLDNYVRQRRLEYGPAIACDLAPQAIMTAAAWPLALLLRDFRAMLCLELARFGLTVAMTHLLADMPYRWAWHRQHLKQIMSFGWPIFLSGMLMALSQQADRIVVNRFYTLNDVAEYSLAFSLITVPFLVFSQAASSTMLPVLSRSQDNRLRFVRQYRVCVECAALMSVALLVPIMAMSDRIMVILYGSKYAGAAVVLSVLAAAVALRLVRVTAFIAATAVGDTKNQLSSNLGRCWGLVLAVGLGMTGAPVIMIAGAAVAGEAVALFVAVWRLKHKQAIPATLGFKAALFVAGGSLAGSGVRMLLPHDTPILLSGIAAAALAAGLTGLGFLFFAEARRVAWGSLVNTLARRAVPTGVVP